VPRDQVEFGDCFGHSSAFLSSRGAASRGRRQLSSTPFTYLCPSVPPKRFPSSIASLIVARRESRAVHELPRADQQDRALDGAHLPLAVREGLELLAQRAASPIAPRSALRETAGRPSEPSISERFSRTWARWFAVYCH
jgi:hypothetical protein